MCRCALLPKVLGPKVRRAQVFLSCNAGLFGPEWSSLGNYTTATKLLDPSPSKDAIIDVVAIHGLWGHSKETWGTRSDPSGMWLRSAFGTGKSCRLILFGYHSSENTFNGVYEMAETLLSKLLELRGQEIEVSLLQDEDTDPDTKADEKFILETARRPIIFISHDLGGLIVKSCLVLAHSKAKYADILGSTRVLINEEFLHTGVLMQTIQLNAYSTKPDISDQLFDKFTATLGIDGELRVGVDASHQLMTQGISSDETPFEGKVDEDWFAPPIYPPRNDKVLNKGAETLRTVLKNDSSTWNHIHHLRCKEGAIEPIAEQCRNFLDGEKAVYRFLHYFRFNSHDVRSNSLRPFHWSSEDLLACWKATRTARPLQDAIYVLAGFDECEQAESLWLLNEFEETRQRSEEPLKIVLLTTAGTTQDSRIGEALSQMPAEVVTTIDYSCESLDAVEADIEVFDLLKEDPRYNGRSISQKVKRLISSLEEDKDLAHLLTKFLHSHLGKWLMRTDPGPKLSYPALTPNNDHLIKNIHWYDILDTCLVYLRRLPEFETPGESFPYAVQHWIHHYKLADGFAGDLERIMEEVFNHEKVLNLWITSYRALPTPPLKPLTDRAEPLVIAAHFGLDTIIRQLSDSGSYEPEVWGRALLESVKVAELSTVRLLFGSMSFSFGLNNHIFHDIVLAASDRGRREILMEVVRRIPKPPKPAPHLKSLRAKGRTVASDNDAERVDDKSASKSERRADPANAIADESDQSHLGMADKDTEQDKSTTFYWIDHALCQASKFGYREAVILLLDLGANPNSIIRLEQKTQSALTGACARGHADVVEILLDHGADLEMRAGEVSNPRTPLFIACTWGSVEVVRLLLQGGASLEAKDTENWTPLHAACIWGAFACIDVLLEHKKLDDYSTSEIIAPLPLAVDAGKYKVAKTLLRHGLDPNSHDAVGCALWYAVKMDRVDLCKLLLENKADPNASSEKSAPPLVQAMMAGNMEIVEMLVESGADLEKPGTLDAFHGSPLLMAVIWAGTRNSKNIQIIRYLLEKKADPNVTDKDGWAPLWLAAWWRDEETVRILCRAQADVNMVCNQRTPLHAAIGRSKVDLEVVRALLDHDADVNTFIEGQGTPLSSAIRLGRVEMIKMILNHDKAKPGMTHPSFRSAVLDATGGNREGIHEILASLLEAGADVDMRDASERTLLMHAMGASPAAVRTILQYQPNLQARDLEMNTVLTCVASTTTVEVVNLIIRCGGRLDVENKIKDTPLISAVRVQNMDVLQFLLTKDPISANINTQGVDGPPLHLACQNDDLLAANLLIEHKADIDYVMESSSCVSGTAIMGAIIYKSGTCARMLIERGANVQSPSGYYRYPIIAASLAFIDVEFIKLLLRQPGVSIDVADTLGRKPAHLACANSLDLFNELQVPDEDLALKDCVGRYPLHYACLSGDSALVEEVLERSKRVGVDINARDEDGWTPLMWAARACDTWAHSDPPPNHHDTIKLFLLRGADPALEAEVVNSETPTEKEQLTPAKIAWYHQADASIISLLNQSVSPERESLPVTHRVGDPATDSNGGKLYCDCCLVRCYGIFFTCADCRPRLDLCFKCSRSRAKIHPVHEMVQTGSTSTSENLLGDAASKEETSAAEEIATVGDKGTSYNFDDEILDLAATLDTFSSGSSVGSQEE
ncbi:hypothetical protein J7T55_000774 [Diaporthe amygdali]|uniref:uncharacterized protein n=1 Tax=Phomopsis amygdali TaxID=1214568 RepID=UPI0022FED729|nr:uncharacterized protein J7T55_000774 [Diaporthe amygdali]KAJ0119924.1 hypothetical protein J7T55_000774 [Diaporthe amygdali]